MPNLLLGLTGPPDLAWGSGQGLSGACPLAPQPGFKQNTRFCCTVAMPHLVSWKQHQCSNRLQLAVLDAYTALTPSLGAMLLRAVLLPLGYCQGAESSASWFEDLLAETAVQVPTQTATAVRIHRVKSVLVTAGATGHMCLLRPPTHSASPQLQMCTNLGGPCTSCWQDAIP